MARINWVDEAAADGPLAEIYAAVSKNTPGGIVPEIYKTMSLRPDFLAGVLGASRLHFSDGALTRAQHEMIAAYVSALTGCHY